MPFLADHDLRPLTLPDARGLRPVGLALGQGPSGLEVMVLEADHRPAATALRAAWKARQGGRAAPLLLAALYEGKASLCGPSGEEPPVYPDLEAGRAEALCRAALAEPDRHAALRFLLAHLPEVESRLPGLRNEGLLATHELEYGVPLRPDWGAAIEKGRALLKAREKELLHRLGFEVESLHGPASLLYTKGKKSAVAIFLSRGESIEAPGPLFSGVSPVSYALSQADRERVDWVIVSQGPLLRLYSTKSGAGPGGRGRPETYVEIHLGLLPEEQAGYLWLLFSGEALTPGGTFEALLENSGRYAADLGTRLRDRIYGEVVPKLAMAVAKARGLAKPDAKALDETYQATLTLLFRLIFIAYAEDQDLLPYKSNPRYQGRSLKKKAQELRDLTAKSGSFAAGSSHWDEVKRLFRAVDEGHREWGVPAYNGGLFSREASVSPAGAALEGITLPNEVFGPILADLLLDVSQEGKGPVDFRSLGVREFGTVYEGLLESELSVAETPLQVGADGYYQPARDPAKALYQKGEIYLHSQAGTRKATGTYYTKRFAVEHLLDHALEPALDAHLARLEAMEDRAAGEAFFDFRVADIAMGSGHFLVAAVDRIERRLSDYLQRRNLAPVFEELARLKQSAKVALKEVGEAVEIEDTQLLRRQIARRCIYGVDLNPLAVELARLAVWIHTFVPGLPLSFLDHHLVPGNSLVGIATTQEANELLVIEGKGGQLEITAFAAMELLGNAKEALERLGRLSDADSREIRQAREAHRKAREAIAPTAALFDMLAASRLDEEVRSRIKTGVVFDWVTGKEPLFGTALHRRAKETFGEIAPFHFPIAFAEVFLGERQGFDVILGNPPWEEATLEEDDFWTRYVPGLQSLPQRDQEGIKEKHRKERPDLVKAYEREVAQAESMRRCLTSGPFPGMGTGDPDVYKAFCWRFWELAAPGGRIGVVFPRSVFAAKGSEEFRKKIFADGKVGDLTFLLNNMKWVFSEVHPQYTVSLATLEKTPPDASATLPIRGPYSSLSRFQAGTAKPPACFPAKAPLEWTDTAALPLLPSEESAEVFARLRQHPRLDLNDGKSWRARPHRELDATNDRELLVLSKTPPKGHWPVFKGESFDIWENDRGPGSYFAWADPRKLQDHLFDKMVRSGRQARSAFNEFPETWRKDKKNLPCLKPRIAFRDVTNRTNRRTVVAALIPPMVVITNKGPFFLWPRGDEKDQAFLLGILCSIPLDWYARRFVETNLNFHILNPFPIPRPKRADPLWKRAVALAGRLASPDDRFAEWAEAVGVRCGPLKPDEKEDMIHDLDAVVALLYGQEEGHLRHVFETFHEGWEYSDRLAAVLKHYHTWKKKL